MFRVVFGISGFVCKILFEFCSVSDIFVVGASFLYVLQWVSVHSFPKLSFLALVSFYLFSKEFCFLLKTIELMMDFGMSCRRGLENKAEILWNCGVRPLAYLERGTKEF